MTEATKLILQQWGAFGAVLIILGVVIWKLWTDTTAVYKATIAQQAVDLKERDVALAEANKLLREDRVTMNGQLLKTVADYASGLANATNAIEASTAVGNDTKSAVRDINEELRRRRPGG